MSTVRQTIGTSKVSPRTGDLTVAQRLAISAPTLTLPQQLANQIGARIIEEVFSPGERLKEVELSEAFGVSRATVREALRILEKRCLVTIAPQRGAHVTQMSRQELAEMFEIRAVLLGLASRRVAETASTGDLSALRTQLTALRAARADAASYARASGALALTITEVAGNELLAQHVASFAERIGRYARLGFSTEARRQQSLTDWNALFDAYERHDADAAEQLHRRLSTRNRDAALLELDKRLAAAQVGATRAVSRRNTLSAAS